MDILEDSADVSAGSGGLKSPIYALSDVCVGGGIMGALISSLDWSSTILGPAETWPQSLLSALGLCLHSSFPVCLYWGTKEVMLYNDAYVPITGNKHPWALGRQGREVWPEIAPITQPILRRVVRGSQAVLLEDQLLLLNRHGYTEECYFNYTLTPVRGESGAVAGILTTVVETTYRVLAERRTRILRQLGEQMVAAVTVEDACLRAVEVLACAESDLPFCLGYLFEGDGGDRRARLAWTCGLDLSAFAVPGELAFDFAGHADDPASRVLRGGPGELVTKPGTPFGTLGEPGPWSDSSTTALVLPISGASRLGPPVGVLVAGLSARRALDAEYRMFVEHAAGSLSTAIGNIRAHDEERRRARALADLDHAKTTFFSNVSHELRTPLSLMLGPLEDMLARPDGPRPEDRPTLERVQRNGLRLLKLVSALLDFSRIEAGGVRARRESIDLAAFTAELANAFRPVCERGGLALDIDCPPLPAPVLVDPDMWEQIVLNLLSNAFKFTFEGAITVRLAIVGAGAALELSVADTGTGIPSEELSHVFDRFRRVEGARGRSHEGAGIGLALVHELSKLHGGQVIVESVVGRGTTFRVRLPLPATQAVNTQAGPRRAGSSSARSAAFAEVLNWLPDGVDTTPLVAPPPGGGARRAHILLVEDNAEMRARLKGLLLSHCDVTAVADGAAALAALHEGSSRPDLVLTDVMMPGIDGVELLRTLRRDPRTRTIPVVVLSARAGAEPTIEGLEAGADDYLTKPFSTAELIARVRKNIDLSRVRQEVADAELREQQLSAEAQRLELLRRIVDTQEDERLHLARELHDQMGQDLTGLSLGLKSLESSIHDEAGMATLHWLQTLTGQIGGAVHRTAWELRPTALDDVGLPRALETYLADWSERFGIGIELHYAGVDNLRAPPNIETTAFRLVQEAFTNVLKHAGASRVSLMLERRGDLMQIIVEDDGKGFDAEGGVPQGRLGLASMRERLALVGGTLTIDSAAGVGTTLYFRLPLTEPAE